MQGKKHVRYVELVGTTECLTPYMKCRRNRGRYNRVQLYFDARGDTWNEKKSSNPSLSKGGIEREAINPVSWQNMKGDLPPNGDYRVNLSRTLSVNVLFVVLSRDYNSSVSECGRLLLRGYFVSRTCRCGKRAASSDCFDCRSCSLIVV
jgi:hypothetical protein